MAGFVARDVVVLPFPFTDFSATKRRPALVLAAFSRGDVLLCQITSQAGLHPKVIEIDDRSFDLGGALSHRSYALPHRLVTAHEVLIVRRVGRLRPEVFGGIVEAVCATIRNG